MCKMNYDSCVELVFSTNHMSVNYGEIVQGRIHQFKLIRIWFYPYFWTIEFIVSQNTAYWRHRGRRVKSGALQGADDWREVYLAGFEPTFCPRNNNLILESLIDNIR